MCGGGRIWFSNFFLFFCWTSLNKENLSVQLHPLDVSVEAHAQIDLHALFPMAHLLCPFVHHHPVNPNTTRLPLFEKQSACYKSVERTYSFPTVNYTLGEFKWQRSDNHSQRKPVRYKECSQTSLLVNEIDWNNMSTYFAGHHIEHAALHLFALRILECNVCRCLLPIC